MLPTAFVRHLHAFLQATAGLPAVKPLTLLCVRCRLLMLLQLLSSLVDAAERLRQFSPVKEGISCAVLEEVRWRLFRVVSCLQCADVALVVC
jgi:hypothetical protein